MLIEFSANPNGKLFNDYFGDIRPKDIALSEGQECEIILNHQSLGMARIEIIRSFPFSRLSFALSYLNCGRAPHYQAGLLNRYYNAGKPLAPDTLLSHIVFTYTERNIENQSILLKEWWETKSEASCKKQ